MRKIWDAICDFFCTIWDAICDFLCDHPALEALVITLGILVVIVGLSFAIAIPLHNADVNEYNDGICSCGGHYEYSQAVGHRMGSTYIYTCDQCGKPIEIDYIP